MITKEWIWENWETAAGVLCALVIVAYSIEQDPALQNWAIGCGATLGAMILIQGYCEKRRVINERIREETRKTEALKTWDELKKGIITEIQNAKSLHVVAVTPKEFVKEFEEAITNLLKNDGSCHFIVCAEPSPAMDVICAAKPDNRSDRPAYKDKVREINKAITALGKKPIKEIELNYLPSHIITAIDLDSEDKGKIYATISSFSISGFNKPTEVLYSRTSEIKERNRFEYFKREIKNLMKMASTSITIT